MFQQILVPLDGEPLSGGALPLAQTLASACGASLRLVQVVSPWDTREDVRAANDYLRKISEGLEHSGLRVVPVVRRGEVAAEVLRECNKAGADLIVVATHGRSGLGRAALGSVTDGLVSASQVPIAVVRPGGRRVTQIRTLLVPLDGTPGGSLALGTAVGLAKATAASLLLVEVTIPIPTWAYGNGMAAYVDPAWDAEALASAEQYVTGMAARLRRVGVAAEGLAHIGQVVPLIIQEAKQADADLIVMSTHGRVGPARTILGSVADALVRGAGRPVLLVRQGSRRAAKKGAAGKVPSTPTPTGAPSVPTPAA